MRVTGTILGGILAVASTSVAAHASVVLTPNAGSYNLGSGAIGTILDFYVESKSYLEVGVSTSYDYEKRGVVEIGIGSIPTGASITSASLVFGLETFMAPGRSYSKLDFYGYEGDGQVKLNDWGRATGTPVATVTANDSASQYSIDITGFLQSLVTAKAKFAGFIIDDRGDGSPESYYWFLDSYSKTNPANHTGPRLVVDWTTNQSGSSPVPEPASLAIVAAPIAALMMRRRKSNRA